MRDDFGDSLKTAPERMITTHERALRSRMESKATNEGWLDRGAAENGRAQRLESARVDLSFSVSCPRTRL